MKLADAMERLRTLETQLDKLKEELLQAATARVTGRPGAPAFDALMAAVEATLAQIAALKTMIGKTIALAAFPDGTSVLEAIARHDRLAAQHSILSSVALAAATALCLPATEGESAVDAAPFLTGLWLRATEIEQEKEHWQTAVFHMTQTVDLAE